VGLEPKTYYVSLNFSFSTTEPETVLSTDGRLNVPVENPKWKEAATELTKSLESK
jgi:Mg-chelatase subunit ChlD